MHLMQQQLALFAPDRQQGMIASVMEQRTIFVHVRAGTVQCSLLRQCRAATNFCYMQKLMEGFSPQEAMAAALESAQLPDVEEIETNCQMQGGNGDPLHQPGMHSHTLPQWSPQHKHLHPAASGRHVSHVAAASLGAEAGRNDAPWPQLQASGAPRDAVASGRHLRSPSHGRSVSPARRPVAAQATEPDLQETMEAWRNDVSNPKAESYRYVRVPAAARAAVVATKSLTLTVTWLVSKVEHVCKGGFDDYIPQVLGAWQIGPRSE
jgi:hypothetical protein